MKVEDRLLIKNLAKTTEIINTINGGMSQANMLMTKDATKLTIRLKVPGVSPESLKIEVRDNQMFIFHMIAGDNSSNIELPYLLTSFVISPKVNSDGIVAEYREGEVFIHLPFDELNDGHERKIGIVRR